MAAILGIINFSGDRSDLKQLCKPLHMALDHRADQWSNTNIDNKLYLEAGHYNFQARNCYEDDHYSLVIDGHIYNLDTLAKTLQQASNNLFSILVHAYEFWGAGFPAFLNGPFAIAVYDKRKKQLILTRDRVGVKPLYFTNLQNKFAFASEQKALLKLPFMHANLDRAAAFDFFIHGQAEHKNESLFQHIHELIPGTCKMISEKGEEQITYFKGSAIPEAIEEGKALDLIKNSLKESVHNRWKGKTNLACFLSGGLDSAVLSAIVNNFDKDPLSVFTANFEGQVHDESKYAKVMAEQNGFEQTMVSPNADAFQEQLETLIYTIDLPNYSSGTFLQYELFKAAGEQNKHYIFDGTGADALFCGHDYYFSALMMGHLRKGELASFRNQWKLNPYKNLFKRHMLKYSVFPKMNKHVKQYFSKKYFPEVKYFNQDFLNQHVDRYNGMNEDRLGRGLNDMLVDEYYNGEVKFLLRFVDRCASKFGLEAISPFADDPSVSDLVFRMPTSLKLKDGQTKYLLRSAYKDDIPSIILNRKDKFGLRVPNNEWMAHIADSVKPYFDNGLNGMLDAKLFKADYDANFKSTSSIENYRWFKFLSFAVWLKVFNVN
jgi:asparagine synthase (glutamine-hydrolysing)